MTPIDRRIGARIRAHRKLRGLSLRAVAEHIGVTHQQIVKYESGATHIAAERLTVLAAILKTSVAVLVGEGRANDNEMLLDDEAVRLLNGFAKIKNPTTRTHIINLVEEWAAEEPVKRH
jgi:transcriptional regulator with XRE-family HTH domain